jgi:hypothetical protein
VKGIYEEPISAKPPENPPHCHVPLKSFDKMKQLLLLLLYEGGFSAESAGEGVTASNVVLLYFLPVGCC